MKNSIDWTRLEQTVRRDAARRGLASFVGDEGRPLLPDHLQLAAQDLAEHGRRVLVVTGFCVTTDDGVTAETDGPPGAIYLAAMLQTAGIDTRVTSDALGKPPLRAGLAVAGLAPDTLVEPDAADYSHLVAVERVGPSHTTASIAAQYSADDPHRDEFEQLVPLADRNACHNMRGISIDAHTAPLHRLFEETSATTVGIVDGGNEIGCGSIPWHVLRRAVAQGSGATIACRIPTTFTIVAGVSNWGAYGLGAAVAVLRGRRDAVELWTAARQRALVEALVRDGGAVDGVTKRREPTVDGLPLDDYLAVFDEVRRTALASL